ncbi:MAG: AAA family ATPase [Deltaproteobacteria bacterium]|nr:AAA family ATPase [Deltaproteobacteria bacterium]
MCENSSEQNQFGVGVDSFEWIVNRGYVYVDKTALIHTLISPGKWSDAPCFLSRPRRFGKTLLVDTMQNIFEGRRELFSGLKIENLMGERWDAFPVIRISFNTFKAKPPELVESGLLATIKRIAKHHEINIDAKDSSVAIADLIDSLSVNHKKNWIANGKDPSILGSKNVVLLIDEYDFPLIANFRNQGTCDDIRLMLHGFYSTIKGCANALRFVFITGITKFREISLFSAMNTTRDITLEPTFAGICGFSSDEIEKYFSKYFDNTLVVLKERGQIGKDASVTDLLKTLADWYNGYTWDARTEVLNPLSVMSFFQDKLFKDYWYETGSTLLTSRIAQNDTDYFKVFAKDLSFSGSLPLMHINKINDTVLLMQAGYLTIAGISGSGTNTQYQLRIPNFEIRDAIRLELLSKFLIADDIVSDITQHLNKKYLQFLNAFATRNEAECEFFLSTIFSGIIQRGAGSPDSTDNNDSTDRHIEQFNPYEFFFRTLLQLLLEFGNSLAIPESFSDIGRSDLAVKVSGNGWVAIEIKHEKADPAHMGADADVSLTGKKIVSGTRSEFVNGHLEKMISAAFAQIIKKNYAKKFLSEGVDVYAAAVAVYGTSDVMVRFKKVVWSEDDGTAAELV